MKRQENNKNEHSRVAFIWLSFAFFLISTLICGFILIFRVLPAAINFDMSRNISVWEAIPFLVVILFVLIFLIYLGFTLWMLFAKMFFSRKNVEMVVFYGPTSRFELWLVDKLFPLNMPQYAGTKWTVEMCKICKKKLIRSHLSSVDGEWSDYKVQLVHYPVLRCTEGHESLEAYSDFNFIWSNELIDSKELWTKSEGFFRKTDYCSHCGLPLSINNIATGSCSVKLQQNKPDNFTVQITGPIYICGSCHVKQIKSSYSDAVMEALANALGNASIRRY